MKEYQASKNGCTYYIFANNESEARDRAFADGATLIGKRYDSSIHSDDDRWHNTVSRNGITYSGR